MENMKGTTHARSPKMRWRRKRGGRIPIITPKNCVRTPSKFTWHVLEQIKTPSRSLTPDADERQHADSAVLDLRLLKPLRPVYDTNPSRETSVSKKKPNRRAKVSPRAKQSKDRVKLRDTSSRVKAIYERPPIQPQARQGIRPRQKPPNQRPKKATSFVPTKTQAKPTRERERGRQSKTKKDESKGSRPFVLCKP